MANCRLELLLVGLLLSMTSSFAQRTLQTYNVDKGLISVSGTSSGGCFATQIHVAFSKTFMGVGVIAGTPYYCAKGNVLTATNACATLASNVNVNDLIAQTDRYAADGSIDPTTNMRNDKIFIFAGNKDTTVVPALGAKVGDYYRNYAIQSHIRLDNLDAEHAFPTVDYGNVCTRKAAPYISKCNYDGAWELLNHIYGDIAKPSGTVPLSGDFYLFNQAEFISGNAALQSMDSQAFAYVPSRCMDSQIKCRLHVSFHGCQQGRYKIGDEYAKKTGYLEVAELNNIIILKPQAVTSGSNPYGCWDWWGYTSIPNYATKRATQMLAVHKMVERLAGGL